MWTMIQFLDSLINLRGKWNQERKYIHGVMNRHKVKGKQFCWKMILVPWRKLSSPKQWAYTFSRKSAYTYSSRFLKNIRGHRCFSYKKRNYLWTERDNETHYERELRIPLSPQAKCRYRFKNKINRRTFKHYMLKNLLEQYSDQYQGYTHFLLTELFYNVYVCTLEFNLFYFYLKI